MLSSRSERSWIDLAPAAYDVVGSLTVLFRGEQPHRHINRSGDIPAHSRNGMSPE